MTNEKNESGQLKEYGPVEAPREQPSSIEPRVRRGMRRLLADVGATHALRELATLCESHAAGMIIDSAKLAFCDAAVHIHRAAALVDGYLVPRGPVDPMNRVIGEVRRCGVGKDLPDDHEVVQELFASYRETARKLNEAERVLGLRAVDKANIAALRKTLGHLSEISAANMETLNANGLVANVLAILNDPTETCEVSASSVERLRAALLAHAKDTNPHDTATGFTNQAAEVIVNLAKQLSRIVDLNKRLDSVEGEVKKTSDEHTAARAELREHADKAKTHDPVRKNLLSELHEVLIEQVPDIALSMSADEVVVLATETVAKQVKQREQVASIIEANAAPIVVTDKLTGHPIGCEAHFAGVRFHCHKTHKREYVDRKQTFVTVDVYSTTDLDVEAIEALRNFAEVGAVAKFHAPKATGIESWATLCEWVTGAFTGEDATFTFMLHATKAEAEEVNRHRFGHQGHAAQAKVMLNGKVIAEGNVEMLRSETVPRADGLYSALVNMMALLWKARFHAEPVTEDASPAAEFVNEHQATLEKLADAFADPLDDFLIVPLGAKDGAVTADESVTSPHAQAYAKGFEPFVATPENDPTPGGAAVSLSERKAEVLAWLRVGPWTFEAHNPPDKLTLDALKSLLDDGLCFTYAGPKGWEFSTVWEAKHTPEDAEIMAAALKMVDGKAVVVTDNGGTIGAGYRIEAALKKLADFGTIERWQDGNHTCYGSRITRAMLDPNFGSNFGPRAHASTSDETDPRNQVANLVREHGGFGRLCINGQPFAASVNATSSGLFIHGEESALSEPMRLLVAITELEAQAPTDLKGHGFTDATMLSPVPSGSARSHAATCLAYAGLLHDLRQALQRSLSGLAISARHNAEQSSDALAYWTAELARMPIPASGFRPSTAT